MKKEELLLEGAKKYPGYAAFQVVNGDNVHHLTNVAGWTVLDTFEEDELVTLTEGEVQNGGNPHRLNVDSLPTYDTYRLDSYGSGGAKGGMRRHLIVRRMRYLLGKNTDGVVAELSEGLRNANQRAEDAESIRRKVESELHQCKKDHSDQLGKAERQNEELERQVATIGQIEADLKSRSDEAKKLRSIVNKVRGHIGQREYDKLFPASQGDPPT